MPAVPHALLCEIYIYSIYSLFNTSVLDCEVIQNKKMSVSTDQFIGLF